MTSRSEVETQTVAADSHTNSVSVYRPLMQTKVALSVAHNVDVLYVVYKMLESRHSSKLWEMSRAPFANCLSDKEQKNNIQIKCPALFPQGIAKTSLDYNKYEHTPFAVVQGVWNSVSRRHKGWRKQPRTTTSETEPRIINRPYHRWTDISVCE